MQQRIKSFVLRSGRISTRQQKALDNWLNNYLLPSGVLWNLNTEFNREAPVVVEVGFGMGDSLLEMACKFPHINYIGIEVHLAGIGALVANLHDNDIKNVRIATWDAVDVFSQSIAAGELEGVQVFFPDPWPKLRHQKRRLIQPSFVALITSKLKPKGFIHCATDWQNYAEQMLAVLSAESQLVNLDPTRSYISRPETRPLTKFEQRGHRLGHPVWDLMFSKLA